MNVYIIKMRLPEQSAYPFYVTRYDKDTDTLDVEQLKHKAMSCNSMSRAKQLCELVTQKCVDGNIILDTIEIIRVKTKVSLPHLQI